MNDERARLVRQLLDQVKADELDDDERREVARQLREVAKKPGNTAHERGYRLTLRLAADLLEAPR